nr:hypothetical protein [Tanacetum cinerariifolium]
RHAAHEVHGEEGGNLRRVVLALGDAQHDAVRLFLGQRAVGKEMVESVFHVTSSSFGRHAERSEASRVAQ